MVDTVPQTETVAGLKESVQQEARNDLKSLNTDIRQEWAQDIYAAYQNIISRASSEKLQASLRQNCTILCNVVLHTEDPQDIIKAMNAAQAFLTQDGMQKNSMV